MANRSMIPLPAAVLECDQLFTLGLLDDFAADRGTPKRSTSLHISAFAREQHFRKSDRCACVSVDFLDGDHIACGDLVLFAAGFDHCVRHNEFPCSEKGARKKKTKKT